MQPDPCVEIVQQSNAAVQVVSLDGLLRGENVSDRVAHASYRPAVGDARGTSAAAAVASGLVKQTIAIETE